MGKIVPVGKVLKTSPWVLIAVVAITGVLVGAIIISSNSIHTDVHVDDEPSLVLSEITILDGTRYPGGDYPNLVDGSIITNHTYDFSNTIMANVNLADIYLHINITRAGVIPLIPENVLLEYCDYAQSNNNTTWVWHPVILSIDGSQLVGACPPSWSTSISANDSAHSINAFRIKYTASGDYSIDMYAAQGAVDIPSAYCITDDRGKDIVFAQAPQRIISLGSAFTEIIFDLDAKSKVVAVDGSSMWQVNPTTDTITNMGSVSSLSVDTVLAQNPDLVVVWNFNMYSAFITNMENANITVAAFYPKNVTTILHTIEVLGEGIGEKAKAQDMVSSMQTRIDAVTSKTVSMTDAQKPKVYLELASQGGTTVGNGTMSNDLISMAGGLNIFADGTGNWVATNTSIILKNPDIIVIENQSSKTNQQLKEFLGTSVTAAANDDIYRIDRMMLTASPRVVDGLEQMARWFYPELFDDGLETVIAGDSIRVNYIGQLPDGRVFDTSLFTVASDNTTYPKSLFYSYRGNETKYGTLNFTVGAGGMISGFDQGVRGMAVGETKTFSISPSEGYGSMVASKLRTINLTETMPVQKAMTKAEFKAYYGSDPVSFQTFKDRQYGWDAFVSAYDGTNVIVQNLVPAAGADYKVYGSASDSSCGWMLNATISGSTITVHHLLTAESALQVKGLDTGSVKMFVESVDEAAGTFVLNKNNEVVGRTLTFTVTIVQIG